MKLSEIGSDVFRVSRTVPRVNFAEAIRNARVSSGITQQGLADRSGCSVHAIWEIEKGNGTVALLVRVLEAMDVRIAGLPRGTSFGERLRTARERRGWSVEKLAARAGVSVMALRRLEQGNARVETLRRVVMCLAPKTRVARDVGGQWRGGERDCRFTPVPMLQQLYRIFGRINLDPCADLRSPVVADRFYYVEDDGLAQPWNADTVFCNPPYSRTTSFLRKAHDSWVAGECGVDPATSCADAPRKLPRTGGRQSRCVSPSWRCPVRFPGWTEGQGPVSMHVRGVWCG